MASLLPTASEATPLLGHTTSASSSNALVRFLRPGLVGQPGWLASYRFFLFGSWLNVLLVFVPLSIVSHYANWDAPLRFAFSFVAILPLAALLGTATEQLSLELGQTLSGLLNASFGNAVEIIVGVAALLQDEYRIVQTSLLGSILSNLLLVLGCSFIGGGTTSKESNFKVTAAQASSSLMTLACITLVIPAAYHSAKTPDGLNLERFPHVDDLVTGYGIPFVQKSLQVIDGSDLDDASSGGLKKLSRGTALILMGVYVLYLNFQLNTHAYLYNDTNPAAAAAAATTHTGPEPSEATAVANGREEEHAALVKEEEEEVAMMSTAAAAVSLLLVTVITSFCADFLVASIEETARRYNIPKPFIGLILLPIVANAAEHVTSVWMAMKNKMELTIGICVGSSIQIAAFVVPLLVIVGWVTHHDLTLFFADFETIVLFVSVLLVNFLIQDGKSNYMEGVMLLALYFVIALAFWVS